MFKKHNYKIYVFKRSMIRKFLQTGKRKENDTRTGNTCTMQHFITVLQKVSLTCGKCFFSPLDKKHCSVFFFYMYLVKMLTKPTVICDSLKTDAGQREII